MFGSESAAPAVIYYTHNYLLLNFPTIFYALLAAHRSTSPVASMKLKLIQTVQGGEQKKENVKNEYEWKQSKNNRPI